MSALYDKKKCPLCGGTVVLKKTDAVIKAVGLRSKIYRTASWECSVCKTEFDADFNSIPGRRPEVHSSEVRAERYTEGVHIAVEAWPKIW